MSAVGDWVSVKGHLLGGQESGDLHHFSEQADY